MSLAKLLAGRKRDSCVWNYFVYDEACDKSTCKVNVSVHKGDGIGKLCDAQFSGKNTSNLVSHLQRFHKEEYSAYTQDEQTKKNCRQGQKRPIEGGIERVRKMQTLESCLERRVVLWPSDSQQHKERIHSVMDMIVDTSLPMTVIDNASFINMIKTMDAKFNVPSM